jgi:hypothetical protein
MDRAQADAAREAIKTLGLEGKRLAIMDDDDSSLGIFTKIYSSIGLNVDPFLYKRDFDDFLEKAGEYQFILVDHLLGGTNGANVAACLMKDIKVSAKVFIFTGFVKEDYKNFKYYYDKMGLINDPMKIFRVNGSFVEQAVETSVLMQMNVA